MAKQIPALKKETEMSKKMSYYRFWRTLGKPKGRIKRMRRDKYKGLGWCKVKTFRFIASPVLTLELTLKLIPITRWNRH